MRDPGRLDDRFDRLAFKPALAAVLIAAAALALGYRYLPLLDWPQHVSMAAVTEHFNDPKWGFARYYRMPGWFLPYQSFRWTQALLGRVFGDSIGFRMALLPYLVGLPLASVALAKRFGRDRWVALASGAVLVEANLYWGFAPFVTGTFLLFVGLVVAIDTLNRGETKRFVLLGAIGVLIFFTHPQAAGLFYASAGFVGLGAWLARRAKFSRVAAVGLALTPGFLMLIYFFVHAGWADGSVLNKLEFPVADMTHWISPRETIAELPKNTLGLSGPIPGYSYVFAVNVLAVAAIAQTLMRRKSNSNSPDSNETKSRYGFAPAILFVLFAVLSFVLPAWGRGEPIAVRVPTLALIVLPFLFPLRPPDSKREARFINIARIAIFAAALTSLGWAHHVFRHYDRSLRPLDRALKLIPTDTRVADLIYENLADEIKLPTYVHIGGYIHAARGGYQSFNFNVLPYADADAKSHSLVPKIWTPAQKFGFRLDAEHAEYYDFVFVKKGRLYMGSPFLNQDIAERIWVEEPFELWQVRHSGG